ncbi:(2Fe-2S)-binding protein [Burkholderia multivorans]|jgi:phenylpropionate dioxygenase-like ring-hydroxylating dioxygenase large terminal subunit|uniref:aromatic ring-hydroxylating oxygenase subunit alpha n=1 Tax=Burkholderiaceae TaxID=119060 RepID=UPI0009E03906|nr:MULTISPECIES: aromatic ring-hydroxylating dioxygenase subunit alpha [Burkholderiaceae]MBU7436246.1 aromatic ring-hydroxylating dioxygenase subunit alpha [Paraburkholderia fungorum]PRF75147.1 (2Fe-2S)-binding protein [Burkholderia multivorans]
MEIARFMPFTGIAPKVWPAKINQIPKEVFHDSELFEDELKRIFYGDEWHIIGHVSEIPQRGDFKTFSLGRVPLLVTRGQDGRVRCFLNSCTHRGNQLEPSSSGNRKEFECPYHRWLFSTNGELVGCPGSREFSPGFEKENHGLIEVRSEQYFGLLCVTLGQNTPPLLDWLGSEVARVLRTVLGGDGQLRLLGYQKVKYASNWKGYADNDGYHAPLLHTGFRLLDWQGGKGAQHLTENGHMAFEAELVPVKDNGFLRDPSLVEYKSGDYKNGSCVVQLFPCTVMTKHLDVISLRFAMARSADVTEVHYASFALANDSDELARHRARQSANLLGPCGFVSMEDAACFHRIHIGNHTPGVAEFQKGVTSLYELSLSVKQNDESGNLPHWEYYRRIMGIKRETEK